MGRLVLALTIPPGVNFAGALKRINGAARRRRSARAASATSRPRSAQFAVLCAEENSLTTADELRSRFAGLPKASQLLGEFTPNLGVPSDAICRAFAPRPQRSRPLPSATHIVLPTGHSPLTNAGVCGVRLLTTFLAGTRGRLPRCEGFKTE